MSTPSPNIKGHSPVGTKYRTYKRATEKLAGWLATTADKLGIETDRIWRKVVTDEGSTHAIKVSQFDKLTDLILEATPKVEVPLEVVTSAEQAYKVRQERAEILRGTDLESDYRHQHVITVISEVSCKLKSRYEDLRRSNLAPVSTKGEVKPVPSYQILDNEPLGDDPAGDAAGVENESSGGDLQVKTTKNHEKKSRKKKKKKQETEQGKRTYLLDEDEDPYFVLMCLLSDLRAMRGYIKEIWQEYKEEKTDLITVSLTTNATFDIIRTYEGDFPTISSLLSDYAKTMEFILSRKLDRSDDGLALLLKPSLKRATILADIVTIGRSLSRIPKLADLTFASAFYFLNGPRHLIVRKMGDKIRLLDGADPFGVYQAEQDRDQLNLVDQLQEDVQILTAFAQGVFRFSFMGTQYDHFTMQWTSDFPNAKDKTVTLAQAFGAQIYLEIHQVLRQNVKRGYQDLCGACLQMDNSTTSWEKMFASQCTEESNELHRKVLTATLDEVYRIRYHATNALPEEGYCSTQGEEEIRQHNLNELKRVSFMENNPLLCGILWFQWVHTIRNVGVRFSTYFGALKRAGQLYYICQSHREAWNSAASVSAKHKKTIPQFLSPWRWDDMDFVFDLYEAEAFFQGRQPLSNYDVLTLHREPEGAAETQNEQDIKENGLSGPILEVPKRESDQVTFAKSLYSFESIAVTHRLYFSKYSFFAKEEWKDQSHWTVETLQALLEAQLKRKELRRIQENKNVKREKKKNATRTTMVDKDGNISQVTILRTLKETLHGESRALHFDLLSFHIRCFEYLCTLRSAFRHRIDKIQFPDDEYFNDHNILLVISKIIEHATCPLPIGSKCLDLYVAGGAAEAFFTTEGHTAIDASIRDYLQENQCRDEEARRLDGIKGISPFAPIREGPKLIHKLFFQIELQ